MKHRSIALVSAAGTVSLILAFFVATAPAELPPLFGGDLGVCKNVEGAMEAGSPLADALLSNLKALFSNEPAALDSIRRTFIHDAIKVCGYDAVAVIEAGYLAGLPLDLLAGSAVAAGVKPATVSSALTGIGADPAVVRAAMGTTRSYENPEPILPPPLAVGSGLGQASPFMP